MAVTTYTVKRGDCLSRICQRFASSIAGNTVWEKVKTVARINDIKDPNVIHTGQVLKFSESGSTSATTPATPQQVTIKGFGIPQVYHELDGSVTDDGRSVFVEWTWTRDNTASFSVHWTEYIGGTIVKVHDDTISIPENTSKDTLYEYCRHTLSAQNTTTKVRFKVLPVADTRKVGNEEVPYWKEGTGSDDVKWSDVKEYDFSNNPPKVPNVPTLEIKDDILTISIDADPNELDAKYVRFNIVKDNATSVHTSGNVEINVESHYASYQYQVKYGSTYKARACCVGANGKESAWSDFSGVSETKPAAPSSITTCRAIKRTDSVSAYLEWAAVPSASKYVVEYTTVKEYFETDADAIQKVETADDRTYLEIPNIEIGYEYFFRVRASNNEGISDPSTIASVKIGEPPAAPTTWSSAKSAFVGESMELSWIHNSKDGSAQSYAQLGLKINDNDWVTITLANTTDTTTGEQIDEEQFAYGKSVSYKGDLHFELDTTNGFFKNAEVRWRVRTAGITDAFSDSAWSVDRTIYIYEKPTAELTVTSDLAGSNIVETLTSFPMYVRAEVDLDQAAYDIQKPIGYYLRVVAKDSYETVDESGRNKVVNAGDAVYSKYFDTESLDVIMLSAENIDLESGIDYTVWCTVDMSTGLTIEVYHDFEVSWTDVSYTISAVVDIDQNAYTASITPYCEDESGELVDNITLAVYRREYNGTLTKIASGIPNNRTAVTDPHPALDYARYRFVAKDTNTGAISFYDMPGHYVGCKAVVIQWDEAWSMFEATEGTSIEGPPWSGSMLVLPYNVSITDNRKREVSLVSYAGREYPVTYYGTKIDETSQWNTDIPKDDAETIYALRRLSLWTGNAYVRESSGMGFWAVVVPKFSVDYDSMTIPVTLEITRVEGGV